MEVQTLPHLPCVNLLGVTIDPLSLQDLLGRIEQALRANQRLLIANVNTHALNLAAEHPDFRTFLNRADIVFCDGIGVRLGAWLTGQRLPHRYTPPDWIDELCRRCRDGGHSLFLLGAKPGVAEKAAGILAARWPGLTIAGAQHGFFDKTPGAFDNERVVAQINEARPQMLLVGFGMPLQEEWLDANWPRLDVNVALTVGALFDYVAGEVPRSPRWMTDHGLEWLGRLLIEPRRLWRRYLVGNPLFLWRALGQRARGQRVRGTKISPQSRRER